MSHEPRLCSGLLWLYLQAFFGWVPIIAFTGFFWMSAHYCPSCQEKIDPVMLGSVGVPMFGEVIRVTARPDGASHCTAWDLFRQ